MRLAIITIALILAMAPVMAMDFNVSTEVGVVGKPANFTIEIHEITSTKTIPADVVLVMDCSGSMMRWGNIITKPKNVVLTERFEKIGEFKLDRPSDVEIMLQKPLDVYYCSDKFEAYIVNKETGWRSSIERGYSIVRWRAVPPGTYEVYAKRCCNSYANRIFCVELPPERLILAKSAAKRFIDMLGKDDRVALVKFTSYYDDWEHYTKIVRHLTDNHQDVKVAIDGLNVLHGTPLGYGIQLAVKELDSNGRKDATKAIIVLTDGWWNMGPDPIDIAKEAAEKGYRIYTIGYGGVDEEMLKQIAKMTGGEYYFAANESDLMNIYAKIAKKIRVYAKDVVLKIRLENVTFVSSQPECEKSGDWLIWNFGDIGSPINVTVTVKSSKVGEFKIGEGWLNYTDANGTRISEKVEVTMKFINHAPIVNVTGNTEIYEKEWLILTVHAIDPDGHSVSLSYKAPISGEFRRINETTWVLKWMPSPNFVESGTRKFTIEFKAEDEFGATTCKNVTVVVHDLKKWLEIGVNKKNVTVYEGQAGTVVVYVDSSSAYDLTYTTDNNKLEIYPKEVHSDTGGNQSWTFSFAPQFDFTNNVSVVNVTFIAKNKDGLEAETNVTIEVLNVNVTVYPKIELPKATIDLLSKGEIYVGTPIEIKVIFVNATRGNVTVNGVEIWNGSVNPPIDTKMITFIPNAAGEYRIVVWAINGANATPTEFVPINVSIKPIS